MDLKWNPKSIFTQLAVEPKNAYKDGRMLIKELFQTDADILPDYENNTLTVIVHS